MHWQVCEQCEHTHTRTQHYSASVSPVFQCPCVTENSKWRSGLGRNTEPFSLYESIRRDSLINTWPHNDDVTLFFFFFFKLELKMDLRSARKGQRALGKLNPGNVHSWMSEGAWTATKGFTTGFNGHMQWPYRFLLGISAVCWFTRLRCFCGTFLTLLFTFVFVP